MGFVIAATLALLNSNAAYPGEDRGTLRRVFHYGQQLCGLEGAVLAASEGLSPRARAMFGTVDYNSWVAGLAGYQCEYLESGIFVKHTHDGKNMIWWTLRTYSPAGKGRRIVELLNPH